MRVRLLLYINYKRLLKDTKKLVKESDKLIIKYFHLLLGELGFFELL
jgi:hypothetical protein